MTTLTLDPEFVRAISNMSELLPRIMLADSNIYSMVDAVQSLPQHLIEVLSQLGSTCRILLREKWLRMCSGVAFGRQRPNYFNDGN
jgi:hypothetical protein